MWPAVGLSLGGTAGNKGPWSETVSATITG